MYSVKERDSSKRTPRFLTEEEKAMFVPPREIEPERDLIFDTIAGEPMIMASDLL